MITFGKKETPVFEKKLLLNHSTAEEVQLARKKAFMGLFRPESKPKSVVKKSKPKAITKKGDSLIQMRLDFGQKKVELQKCPDCAMTYHPNLPDDVKLHSKYHDIFIRGIDWNVSVL